MTDTAPGVVSDSIGGNASGAGTADRTSCGIGLVPATGKDHAVSDTPNPGSKEAQAQGCICAVLDNNHGKTAPWPPDGWWISEGCPVHARRVEQEEWQL